MDTKPTLGRRIRALREQRGFSQTDLATQVGIEPSYVSLLEADKRVPSLSMVEKIAEALGVRTLDLVSVREGADARPERTTADLLREAESAIRRLREREMLFAQGGFLDLTPEELAEVEAVVRRIRARRGRPSD